TKVDPEVVVGGEHDGIRHELGHPDETTESAGAAGGRHTHRRGGVRVLRAVGVRMRASTSMARYDVPVRAKLPPDAICEPLANRRLVGDGSSRGDLAQRLYLHGIELDGQVPEAARPCPAKDLTTELLVERELDGDLFELPQDAAAVVVRGDRLA